MKFTFPGTDVHKLKTNACKININFYKHMSTEYSEFFIKSDFIENVHF